MNSDHIYGRLRDMKVGKKGLEGTPTRKLIIRPRNRSRNGAENEFHKDAANDEEL